MSDALSLNADSVASQSLRVQELAATALQTLVAIADGARLSLDSCRRWVQEFPVAIAARQVETELVARVWTMLVDHEHARLRAARLLPAERGRKLQRYADHLHEIVAAYVDDLGGALPHGSVLRAYRELAADRARQMALVTAPQVRGAVAADATRLARAADALAETTRALLERLYQETDKPAPVSIRLTVDVDGVDGQARLRCGQTYHCMAALEIQCDHAEARRLLTTADQLRITLRAPRVGGTTSAGFVRVSQPRRTPSPSDGPLVARLDICLSPVNGEVQDVELAEVDVTLSYYGRAIYSGSLVQVAPHARK